MVDGIGDIEGMKGDLVCELFGLVFWKVYR